MTITKTVRYAEGIMEGAWLAAVILLPFFFNKYSAMSYQPDKVTAVRSLLLVMLAAWLIKMIEQNGITWRALRTNRSTLKSLIHLPLFLPVAATAFIDIISFIFSITPLVSFWGDYTRLQGLYSTLSYLLIFVIMTVNVRKREQLDRIITTIITTSLPVCVYAIGQRFNIDPIIMTSSEYEAFRVTSTLGAPVFLAAYLIMVFPLTIMRIANSVRNILRDTKHRLQSSILTIIYSILAIIQVIVIIFTASRGPFIGLTIATIFFILVFSIYWKKKWLVFAGVGLGTALVGFLLIMNIPSGPLQGLRANPTLDRLAKIFDPEAAISSTRDRYWQMAAELYTSTKPLEFVDGSKDSFFPIRQIFGYGPDTLASAVSSIYRYDIVTINRFHNEVWDILFTKGALGLLIQIGFIGFIFYFGLKWLDLIQNRRQKFVYWLLFFGGILLGTIGLGFWRGWIYLGLGMEVGLALGPLAYLVVMALGKFDRHTTGEYDYWALVLMALLSAIIAHTVEVGFSFKIETTFTYFWIYLAMIMLIGYIIPMNENPTLAAEAVDSERQEDLKQEKLHYQRRGKTRLSRRSTKAAELFRNQNPILNGLVIGIMLVVFIYDFIHPWVGTGFSATGVFWDSLTRLPGKGNIPSTFVIGLGLVFWNLAVVVFTLENNEQNEHRNITWLGITMVLSGGIALIFGLLESEFLASLNRYEAVSGRENLARISGYETLFSGLYLMMFGLISSIAIFTQEWKTSLQTAANRTTILMLPVVTVLLFLTVSSANLNIILASISASKAEEKPHQLAVSIYQRAINLAPMEPEYWLLLGNYYTKTATNSQNPAEREQLLLEGAKVLKIGQPSKMQDIRFTGKLAEIYSNLSAIQADGGKKLEYGKLADGYYATVVRLSPYYYRMWTSWALNDLRNLNQLEDARKKLERSLEINSGLGDTQALLGAYYWNIANSLTATDTKKAALEKSISHYQAAVNIDNRQYNYQIDLAELFRQVGSAPQAIDAYQRAITNSPTPNPNLWKIFWTISTLKFQLGDFNQAAASATSAIQNSPKPNPDLWKIYTFLGDAYRSQNINDKAVEAYQSALSSSPDVNLVWRIEEVLAQVYFSGGSKNLAVEHGNKALQMAPEENKAAIRDLLIKINSLP